MPISKQNRKRYPANWRVIRAQILERAGGCCEGGPHYPNCRARNHAPHPVTGSRVVLTIAHLNHTPEDCEPSNLLCLCQRCHNSLDAPMRAKNAAATRRAKRSRGQMPLEL